MEQMYVSIMSVFPLFYFLVSLPLHFPLTLPCDFHQVVAHNIVRIMFVVILYNWYLPRGLFVCDDNCFILIYFSPTSDHCMHPLFNVHFGCNFMIPTPMWIPLDCVRWSRLTMMFIPSPRPIRVIYAECICGLLIYIFVNLGHVHICHPTIESSHTIEGTLAR